MIKVKRDLVQKVICLGKVVTRRYTYFCDGRCDFDIKREGRIPLCFVVYRMSWEDDARLEIVGLFDREGKRL